MSALSSMAKEIPSIGLGTWKIPRDRAEQVVYEAIVELGVRHLDCACDYGNEVEVGRGIQRAIAAGAVTREDLWITSKLWNTYHLPQHVPLACDRSLRDLQLQCFDLYMVHFPIAMKFVPFEARYPPEWIHDPAASEPRIELEPRAPMHLTWGAMEALVDAGKTRHIGVCNFNVQLLMDLQAYARIPPHSLQVEMHPLLCQQALLSFCQKSGIRVTAFSPLGSPSYVELNMDGGLGVGLLEHPTITAVAAEVKRTPAQVLLRWNIQRGVSVIPKATQKLHLAENLQIFDFELSEAQMSAIAALDKNMRFNDPGEFCKGMGGAIAIYA